MSVAGDGGETVREGVPAGKCGVTDGACMYVCARVKRRERKRARRERERERRSFEMVNVRLYDGERAGSWRRVFIFIFAGGRARRSLSNIRLGLFSF